MTDTLYSVKKRLVMIRTTLDIRSFKQYLTLGPARQRPRDGERDGRDGAGGRDAALSLGQLRQVRARAGGESAGALAGAASWGATVTAAFTV